MIETPEEQHAVVVERKLTQNMWKSIIFLSLATLLLLPLLGWWYINLLLQAPEGFPTETTITVAPGTSVRDISTQFAEAGFVRSELLLYATLVMLHDPTQIKASTYQFDQPLDTLALAHALTEGDFDTNLTRFTHIEGERNERLATRVAQALPGIQVQDFLAISAGKEGYLYPDTYFLPVEFTAAELVALMLETYEAQVSPLRPLIADSGWTEDEIITLASIIEREANTPESMQMVAGVFYNRLNAGMPLQADATIEYVLDRPINDIPPEEFATLLKTVTSPYNTYAHAGLPPTPIGNPGITAISAAVTPAEHEYYYYITGTDGEFYYARTLTEHNQNIARHLR